MLYDDGEEYSEPLGQSTLKKVMIWYEYMNNESKSL